MKKYQEVLKECANEIQRLDEDIAKEIEKLINLPQEDAYLGYLKIIDKVSMGTKKKKHRNLLMLTLWKHGERLEDIINPSPSYFKKSSVLRKIRFIDEKIISLLFIVFILFPATTSSLWNFTKSYTLIPVNKEVTFNGNLCQYRTAWLYDFRASMVCIIRYRYGNVNIKLNPNNTPIETAVEVEKLISNISYDYGRLKSVIAYIQTPQETLGRKIGVCSDFAILAAQILLDNNVSPVYIIHTIFKGDESGGHAAAAIDYNGTLWVIDWGSSPTPFQKFIEKISKLWEIQEIRVYKITRDQILLDRVYKGKSEYDGWRFIYFLTIMLGVLLIKRREWIWL
ncbi:transglutaminase-like domain-containing protein [Pyrococcus kukulkanii]|uniref:transglutaminase-like domain-containing protein n=1 Tax=Pyrococcus kukulkanii TaxID=1609559 RepID=UPI003563803A